MVDKSSFEYELYEVFKDQFSTNIRLIENDILALQEISTYEEAVHEMFRIFHGLKGNSLYFHFEPIIVVAKKVEKVLSVLRDESGPADETIIEWLLKVCDQMLLWSGEMDSEATEFSNADTQVLNEIHFTKAEESPAAIMKKLSIIYVSKNNLDIKKLTLALKNGCNSVTHVVKLSDFEMVLLNETPDICILNVGEDTLKTAQLCQKHMKSPAVIAVLEKSDRATQLQLAIEGVNHTINKPIATNILKRELLAATESHFTSRHYLITNKKIKEFIETLQPLPDSIFQIQQICDDDEMSVKDLIKVVKADPIISGVVLQAANNSIYGLNEIHTIDQAVTIFGKKSTQAIALSKVADMIGNIDLSAYNVSETTFSKVAALRLMLMVKWYSKVSIASLSILSTTAILGNIGQLLIAKEIDILEKKELFLDDIKTKGIQHAEEKYMHTTTPSVSSDILSYWQLNRDVVDSIRFSDHPKKASPDIIDLCIANHIVYRLIELDGTIHSKIPKKLEMLLQTRELNIEPLNKALNAVVKISNK